VAPISEYIATNQIVFVVRLRNDLYCVEWGVKLYSLTHCFCSPLFTQ